MNSISNKEDDVSSDDFNVFQLLLAQQLQQKNIIADLVCQPCVDDHQQILSNDINPFDLLFCQFCSDETSTTIESVEDSESVIAVAKPIVDSFDAVFQPMFSSTNEPLNESEANKTVETFSMENIPISSEMKRKPRSCIGHKERILGSAFSECGKYLATASQDSTVKIWNVDKNQLLSTINLNKDYEALRVVWANSIWYEEFFCNTVRNKEMRYPAVSEDSNLFILATGGADGVVRLYSTKNPEAEWSCLATIDHALYRPIATRVAANPGDKPQVYSLQFIDPPFHTSTSGKLPDFAPGCFLLTSTDDHLHIWKISIHKKLKLSDGSPSDQLMFTEDFSVQFSIDSDTINETCSVKVYRISEEQVLSSSSVEQLKVVGESNIKPIFGGQRNPLKLVYVFDASYCAANGFIGAALSDGSFRILDDYGNLLSTLDTRNASHLTSFSWHSTGEKIAACTATGHLIVWTIAINDTIEHSKTMQQAVAVTRCDFLNDGYDSRAPLYGALFLDLMYTGNGHNNEIGGYQYRSRNALVVSWSSNGKLCLWDSDRNVLLSVLRSDSSYPLYSVSTNLRRTNEWNQITFAVAGGGATSSFIGIPFFLYSAILQDCR